MIKYNAPLCYFIENDTYIVFLVRLKIMHTQMFFYAMNKHNILKCKCSLRPTPLRHSVNHILLI